MHAAQSSPASTQRGEVALRPHARANAGPERTLSSTQSSQWPCSQVASHSLQQAAARANEAPAQWIAFGSPQNPLVSAPDAAATAVRLGAMLVPADGAVGTSPGALLWPPSLSASVMSGVSLQGTDHFHGSYLGTSMGASLGARPGRAKRFFTDGHDSARPLQSGVTPVAAMQVNSVETCAL